MDKCDLIDSLVATSDNLPAHLSGRELSLPIFDGMTLLCKAAGVNDAAQIRTLIARGASVNGIDLRGRTPLTIAASIGHYRAAKRLLKLGADTNISDKNGRTALMYALYEGHLPLGRLLVSKGADGTIKDADGRSALNYAGHYKGNKDVHEAMEVARRAGATDDETTTTPIPAVRSDVDFATIEALHNIDLRIIMKSSVKIVGLLFAIEVLYHIFFSNNYLGRLVLHVGQAIFDFGFVGRAIIYICFSTTPHFGAGYSVQPGSSLIVGLVAWAVSIYVLAGPTLRRRRTVRLSREYLDADQGDSPWIQALGQSGGQVRALSGLLSIGGRRIPKQFGSRTGAPYDPPASTAIFMLMLTGVVPYVAGFIQTIMGITGQVACGPRYWNCEEWVPFVLRIIVLFVAVMGASAVIQRRGVKMFSSRLVDKQRYRSERMEAEVADMSRDEGGEMPQGEFVLYLRPFDQDDKVQIGNFNFETTLAYALSEVVEVVAMGVDTSKLGPTAVVVGDEGWQHRVELLSKQAALVVMIPGPTAGVQWEVEMLQRNGLLEKTVFVAPPAPYRQEAVFIERWQRMRRTGVFRGLEIPIYAATGFVFSLSTVGELVDWGALGLELEPPPIAAMPTEGTEGDGGTETGEDTYFDTMIADDMDISHAYVVDTMVHSTGSGVDSFHDFHDSDYHHHHD